MTTFAQIQAIAKTMASLVLAGDKPVKIVSAVIVGFRDYLGAPETAWTPVESKEPAQEHAFATNVNVRISDATLVITVRFTNTTKGRGKFEIFEVQSGDISLTDTNAISDYFAEVTRKLRFKAGEQAIFGALR